MIIITWNACHDDGRSHLKNTAHTAAQGEREAARIRTVKRQRTAPPTVVRKNKKCSFRTPGSMMVDGFNGFRTTAMGAPVYVL